MDKKILIVLTIAVLAVLFASFLIYDGGIKDDTKRVETIEDLYSALESGSAVRLDADITFTEVHKSSKNINWDLYVPAGAESELDLNGHTLNCVSTWGIKVFGKLTIYGDGKVINSNENNSVVVGSAGSADALLIIRGGYYDNIGDSETVLARDGGHVEIYDGTFTSKIPDVTYSNGCVLNIEDQSKSVILAYGGTYIGYDPSRGDNNSGHSTFVAEGYESVSVGDKTYTVKPKA